MRYLKFNYFSHFYSSFFSIWLIFFLLCSVFIFNSCESNLDITIPPFEKKLVIESYLYENETVLIAKLSESRSPFTQLKGHSYDSLCRAHEAVVSIKVNDNQFIFAEDTGKYFPPQWYSTSAVSYYICENKNKDKLSGKAEINVLYKGKEYSAVAAFPEKPEILSATVSFKKDDSQTYYNNVISPEISIVPQTGDKNYYKIITRTEFESGYGNYKYLSTQENSEYFYIKNEEKSNKLRFGYLLYQTKGTKYKSITIIVEHIDGDYYKFLDACKTQVRRDNSPIGTEGTEIPSSFRDCYGIFTCITRDTVCIKLD